MSRKTKNGVCHLCGIDGPLTFEHVPPEAAYNDARVLEADIHRLISAENLIKEIEEPKGKYNQRGAGRHTLCARCNNDTGSWYGADYVKFTKNIFPLCMQKELESANFIVSTYPLRIFKQIMTMFCSACPPEFSQKNLPVRRFLLNRESREFPHDISLYASLHNVENSKAARQSGISALIDFDRGISTFSEICFPPFNFVMTLGNTMVPDERLLCINYLRYFNYDDVSDLEMNLTNLSVVTHYPGDYRTLDQIRNI
jgi:hypothetical protein